MSAATHAEPGFIALEGGDARVEVLPGEGARIRSLQLFDREWLLGGTAAVGRTGLHPTQGFGWTECAPVAGAGEVPSWVKGIGGRAFVAGGELRSLTPELSLTTDAEGHKLRTVWTGLRAPWRMSRTLLVRPDGGVEARYEAMTTGAERLPFPWSLWLALPLTPATRLRLPEAQRLRVSRAEGCVVTPASEAGGDRWPQLTVDGRRRDLSSPWSLPRRGRLNAWVDLSAQRAQLGVLEDESRLGIAMDGAGVTHLAVAIDRAGTARARRRGLRTVTQPALTLGLSLAAPDTYAQALGEWQAMTWLTPGETRCWTITFRGGAA